MKPQSARRHSRTALASAALFTAALSASAAPPYAFPGPPIGPAPGPLIQAPGNVFGKEYTDLPDVSAAGVPTPGSILFWDGAGGVAQGPIGPIAGLAPLEIDALANNFDALFFEVSFANTASLVASVTGDSAPAAGATVLWTEHPAGATASWATAPMVNAMGVADLDAVELWGPELVSDSNRVSLAGDPLGVAIWNTATGIPMLSTLELSLAIAPSLGVPFLIPDEFVDLDALMYFGDATSGVGDIILFSVLPITIPGIGLIADGGEVWTYTIGGGAGPAAFLLHGGHLWDTAFPVMASLPGAASENIDALEAVGYSDGHGIPEPGTYAFGALLGLTALNEWRRRRVARG